MAQLQPGSTVKPMVGLTAITAGLASAAETVECTGYLVIDGKYTARQVLGGEQVLREAPRPGRPPPRPWDAPHPTGYLDFGDALERSCNVYFETMANRLGLERLCVGFDRFGLGRPTGIGIAEARGRLPRDFDGPHTERQDKTWFSGIGQDPVAATPIQMANVAATIARGGVWMRPRLLPDADAAALGIQLPLVSNHRRRPAGPPPRPRGAPNLSRRAGRRQGRHAPRGQQHRPARASGC